MFKKHTTRLKQPTSLRVKYARLCLLFTVLTLLTSVRAYAAMNLDPNTFVSYSMQGRASSGTVDISLPAWKDLSPEKGSGTLSDKQKYYASVKAIFPSQQAYENWCRDLKSTSQWDADTGALVAKSATPGSPTQKEYASFSQSVTGFNKYQGSAAVAGLTENIFRSGEFDPTDALVMGFMQGFYTLVNTLFSMFAQFTFWLFLLQTGADCLYIAIPMTRRFLALAGEEDFSGGSSSGMYGYSGGGGRQQKSSWFKITLVSREAIEACQARYGGGARASYSDSMGSKKNVFLTYFGERFPVILMLSVYIVMVRMGAWSMVISKVSGIVAEVFGQVFA